MGYAYTKKVFIAYLKFRFKWESCDLFGSPMELPFCCAFYELWSIPLRQPEEDSLQSTSSLSSTHSETYLNSLDMFSAARLRGNVIHRKVPIMLASFSRFPISRDLIIAFTIVIIIVNFSHCTYIQDASVDEVTVHMGKPDEKERNSIQCDEQLP